MRRETGLLGGAHFPPLFFVYFFQIFRSLVFVSIGQWSLERALRLLFSIELDFSENLIDLICNRVGGKLMFSLLCLFLLLVFVSVGQRVSENSPW